MLDRTSKPVAFLLSFFFVGGFFIAAVLYGHQPLWTIGDWLINYSAGFVRRGLPGEFFLLISRLLHVRVALLALIIPALVYGGFLVEVFRLASPLKRNFLWFAMLFSPATIPFIVLNNDIGFRKETLLLGALALLIYMLQRGVRDLTLVCTLTVLLAALVLSHEGTIICFPYFVVAIMLVTGAPKRAVKLSALPMIVACILFVVVSQHPGAPEQARLICQSVGGTWTDMPPGKIYPGLNGENGLCAGSIAWIGKPVSLYRQQRAEANLLPVFALRIPLAFLPFLIALAVMYWNDKLRVEVRWLAGTALLCFLGSLSIFVVALDWGRWIYMQTACLMLVTLLAAKRAPSFLSTKMDSPSTSHSIPLGLATFFYCAIWTVPTNSLATPRWGYLSAASQLRWYMHLLSLRRYSLHDAYRAWVLTPAPSHITALLTGEIIATIVLFIASV